MSAYEQLLAEGYVVGRGGSGTYVSDRVLQTFLEASKSGAHHESFGRTISAAGTRYGAFGAKLEFPKRLPFVVGCCSADSKTLDAWRRIGVDHGKCLDPANLAYADPSGDASLRTEVARYLRASRAVKCDPEQIIIVSGAQHAIDLSTRVLLNCGDAVWVEDPGYQPTREALGAFGATVVGVPVDERGMMISEGIAVAPQARAAYVTPSHQYPTGAIMSMERRFELLEWAASTGSWIIEDDYDSEFRYAGPPLASLQGLDRDGAVIYVGTLSKVLFPGIRLGFAVVPEPSVDAFRGARFLSDRSPPALQQAVTAEFMKRGYLMKHIRRTRRRYREARDVVVESIDRHMGQWVDVETPSCGDQLGLRFKVPISDIAVMEAARDRGVIVKPLSAHFFQAQPRQGLVLGYSGYDNQSLRTAAAQLGEAVRVVADICSD